MAYVASLGCTPLARGLPDATRDAATTDATDASRDATGDATSDATTDARDATTDAMDVSDARDATPDAPDVVDAPDAMDAPDVLDAPDAPDVLDAPDAADATDVTDVPAVRDVVDAADAMDAPAVIDTPMSADAPDVMDAAPDVADVTAPDIVDVVDVSDGAVCEPSQPARLVGPISNARVTTRRPLLRWELPPAATGANVEFCRDRACTTVLGFESVVGSSLRVTRTDLLTASVVWWRVRPTRAGVACGGDSATWALWPERQSSGDGYAFSPLVDVNGDGRTDAILSAHGTAAFAGRAQLYVGQSDGLPAAPTQTLSAPVTGGDQFGFPYAGDFNGDGLTDVAIAQPNARTSYRGRVWVYLSDGARFQTPPQELVQPAGGYNYFGIWTFPGDFNGDGYADVAVVSGVYDSPDPMGGHLYVYNGGPSGPRSDPSYTVEGSGGMGSSFAESGTVLDLDGDGYDDLLATLYAGDSRAWVVLRGSATGLRRDAALVTTVQGQRFSGGVPNAIGDVTGDGRVDYATTESSTGSPRLLVAAGSATGTPGATGLILPLADSPSAVGGMRGEDIDADGRADVVIVQTVGGVGKLYVYPSRSTTFGTPLVLTAGAGEPDYSHGSLRTGDYNGDGWRDILSVHYTWMDPRGAYSLLLGASGGGISSLGRRGVLGPDSDSRLGFRLAFTRFSRSRGSF